MDNVWTVTYMDGDALTEERVYADGWQVSGNGDLAFMNDPRSATPFFTRAYAAGTWQTVSLYA
jgi:hypothetical protein